MGSFRFDHGWNVAVYASQLSDMLRQMCVERAGTIGYKRGETKKAPIFVIIYIKTPTERAVPVSSIKF